MSLITSVSLIRYTCHAQYTEISRAVNLALAQQEWRERARYLAARCATRIGPMASLRI